jgi:DNA-directed RNA polymerase subunit RPC12/RpoP
MASVLIACSSCGVTLKLPDARLAGKKVKCPKCGARFIIAVPSPAADEPEEVPLQLVDPAKPDAPMLGKSPRWVPDSPSPVLPTVSVTPPGEIGKSGIDPSLQSFLASESEAKIPPAPTVIPRLATDPETASASVIDRVKNRRRNSRNVPMITSIAIAILSAVVGSIWLVTQQAKSTVPAPRIKPNVAYQESIAAHAASNEEAKTLSPTSGKPIPVDYLPFTPHVICHLHPAELWNADQQTLEFQALLSSLGIWLNDQIRTRTCFEPEEISELTFTINFGTRMSAPDVAAVVRLKSPQTDQEFKDRFKGRFYADPKLELDKLELYEADNFSYLRIDPQTIVVAGSTMSESLVMSFKDPALLSPDMAPLLQQSDRDRHLTLLFDLPIIDSHREDAFIQQVQTLADKFLFWFGEDVQAVSWSVHLEPDLYMETLLRQTQASTPAKLQRFARQKLSHLPDEILSGVRKMRPATVGARTMIGRFPAMIKAVEVGTTTHIDPAGVRLITLLPQHAASNLAAATMLTWNQSLLTNFDDNTLVTKTPGGPIPDKVADRLKTMILIDFRATPLQEAFGYIGESIKTEIVIDGDALKAAGFTQNMPQTWNLGKVTALTAIDTILQKYSGERDPMILVVDEAGKKLLFSTVSKAKADGLTIFETRQ